MEFIKELKNTMAKTRDMGILWFNDEYNNKVLGKAAKLGLVRRLSHTQVEWTEKGAEACTMAQTKNKNRINELVKMINEVKAEIQAKKDAGIKKVNGWISEYAERDLWVMQQKVNKLAGLTVYK